MLMTQGDQEQNCYCVSLSLSLSWQGLRCGRVVRSGSVFASQVMPSRLLHQSDPPALPQLPVPQLQDTLTKYLKCVTKRGITFLLSYHNCVLVSYATVH